MFDRLGACFIVQNESKSRKIVYATQGEKGIWYGYLSCDAFGYQQTKYLQRERGLLKFLVENFNNSENYCSFAAKYLIKI